MSHYPKAYFPHLETEEKAKNKELESKGETISTTHKSNTYQ
jgi:hypothetical protein